MKLCVLVFLYILYNVEADKSVTQKDLNTGYCFNEKRHEVDDILVDLQLERWSVSEESCYEDTLSFLYGVKNRTLWATWVWDSNSRPTGTFYGSNHHLGGYDQCLKTPWVNKYQGLKTQYCLADIVLSEDGGRRDRESDPFGPMEEYFDNASEMNRQMNTIFYGICIPAKCENSSVHKISRIFFKNSHLGTLDAKISINYCQTSAEHIKYPMEFYAFIFLCMTLIMISIISTWCVRNKESNNMSSSVCRAFCMKRNVKDLLKVHSEDLPSVNLLKMIVTFSAVTMHHSYFGIQTATMNSLDLDKYLSSAMGSMILNANTGVDCFYAVGGTLLAKSLLGKQRNPLRQILTRYLRLATPFAFMILYTICISYHIGDGPIWGKHAKLEQDNCKKNWLWSILMMNNYVNNKEICQRTWWYIPTDFHIAVIATLVIYLYQKKIVGNKFLTGLSAIFISIPGFVTYWNNYKPVPIYDVDSLLDLRNNEIFQDIYVKSHNRMGSTIVGMLTGYILWEYKPASFKNIINEKWTTIGVAVFFLTQMAIIKSGNMMMNRDYNPVEAAIYASTYRVVWSLLLCLIILLAEYGESSLITFVRRSPIFTVINRLSYSIYLTHTAFIQWRWYSSRNPYFTNTMILTMDSIGVFVFTLGTSFILWLFVEAPMSNLTNTFVNPRSNAQVQNSKKQDLLKQECKLMKIGS